jgi:hypothetical protein
MDALTTATPSVSTDQATPMTESDIKDQTAPEGDVQEDDAPEPGNEKTRPEATPDFKGTKHKVKINGEELEVEYDELVRNYQLNKAITKKEQETAKLRREIAQEKEQLQKFFESAKQDKKVLWELARKFGHNPEELAEELVWEKLQYERMTPEQRELHELRKEREARQKEKEDAERRQKELEAEEEAKRYESEIEEDVLAVVDLAGRKPTPSVVARIAEIYQSHITAKKQKPSREVVAQKLRHWYDQELTAELTEGNIDQFIERLPRDALNKLNEHLVSKARKHLPSSPSPSRPSAEKSQTKPKPKSIGVDEFFKNL